MVHEVDNLTLKRARTISDLGQRVAKNDTWNTSTKRSTKDLRSNGRVLSSGGEAWIPKHFQL